LDVLARTGVRVDLTASGATLGRPPDRFDAGGGGRLDLRLLAFGACETGAALVAAPRRLGGEATPLFDAGGAFDRGPLALDTGGVDARDLLACRAPWLLGARLRREGTTTSSTDGGGYESEPAPRGAPARSERDDRSSAAARTSPSSSESPEGGGKTDGGGGVDED
jgi:hypothetical protein